MREWDNLILWLKQEHGMNDDNLKLELRHPDRCLCATADIQPNQVLLEIPASALVNQRTLNPIYPSTLVSSINAVQLISLHLALHRHTSRFDGLSTTKELFLPYVAILPASFDGVPLWHMQGTNKKEAQVIEQLLEHAPKRLQAACKDVQERFLRDWTTTETAWRAHYDDFCNNGVSKKRLFDQHVPKPTSSYSNQLDKQDFLWGWLCVNTRDFYYNVGASKREDNITLAPVMDLINHTQNAPCRPEGHAKGMTLYSSSSSSHLFQHPSPLIKKGKELFFEYGKHDNILLLSEYGFTLEKNENDHISVDEDVLALFKDSDQNKHDLLDTFGYLKHLCIDLYPKCSPSWNLLVCLRLLHLLEPKEKQSNDEAHPYPQWQHMVNGYKEIVSRQNELAVYKTLLDLAQRKRDEASDRKKELDACVTSINKDKKTKNEVWKAVKYIADSISTLWDQQMQLVDRLPLEFELDLQQ